MKIHPKLKEQHDKCKGNCPKGCNNYKDEGGCVNYVSCGPQRRCEEPCEFCLYWTGYPNEEENK